MSTIGYINVSFEIWGAVLCFVILLCLLAGQNLRTDINRKFFPVLICNGALLLSDAAAWLFKGHIGAEAYWGVRISNFLVFALGFVLLTAFTRYLTAFLAERTSVSRKPLRLIQAVCVIAFILVIVSQFNGMLYGFDQNNMYHRGDWFWLSQIGGIIGMVVNLGLLIRYRANLSRMEMAGFSSYIVLPIAAMIVQIFAYGIACLNLMTTLAILIIFLFIQVEQARKFREKELELADSRIAGMMSQIRPHFLFNSLTAIRQLCDCDPGQAKEAIFEFSGYLRANLDALTFKGCIPFEREIVHVKNYLSLEKKRFGDVLQIVYDLRAGNFLIPPITVQPIVENAVRHGITKKKGGGTVTIRSCETKDAFVVVVEDDGVGFSGEPPSDGKSHIGIENVRKRIEAMCGGSLMIRNRQEEGTEVTITVPKGGVADADDCGRR